jgi:uncharacterized membrane protein YesL
MTHKKIAATIMMMSFIVLIHVIVWQFSNVILGIQISLLQLYFISIILELFSKLVSFISRKVLESF